MPPRLSSPPPAVSARWGRTAADIDLVATTSWRVVESERVLEVLFTPDLAALADLREHHLAAEGSGRIPSSGLRDATLSVPEAERLPSAGPLLALLRWAAMVRAIGCRVDLGGLGEWTARWSPDHWRLSRRTPRNSTMSGSYRPLDDLLVVAPPANASDDELLRTYAARAGVDAMAGRLRAIRNATRGRDVTGASFDLDSAVSSTMTAIIELARS